MRIKTVGLAPKEFDIVGVAVALIRSELRSGADLRQVLELDGTGDSTVIAEHIGAFRANLKKQARRRSSKRFGARL